MAEKKQIQKGPLAHPSSSESEFMYERRVQLIRTIRQHPDLYKNQFLRLPNLQRQEKQILWDIVAKESGFDKTEDARSNWRSLICYLRQHLHHVALKKRRRYIPNSSNPEDKYMQLDDWMFYKEMEFIVPYVKNAVKKPNEYFPGNHMQSSSENDEGIIMSAMEDNPDILSTSYACVGSNSQAVAEQDNEICEQQEPPLTEDEEILKEFFENMLKSTLSLPRFHQKKVKTKLMQVINEQHQN